MPAMVVTIINITDAPESKKPPTRLAIYTTHLDPGDELKLPASMVDARLRKLESDGYIAIGQLPSWYAASKARKNGRRPLTAKELEERVLAKPKEETPAETAPEVKDRSPKKKTTFSLDALSAEDKSSDKK